MLHLTGGNSERSRTRLGAHSGLNLTVCAFSNGEFPDLSVAFSLCALCCLPQACMRDIPACKWLDQWTELAQKYEPPPSCLNAAVLRICMCSVRHMCLCVFGFQVCIPIQPISPAQSSGGVWLHQ